MKALAVLLLLALAALALLLFNVEWTEEVRNDGYGEAALRNPYLAAAQFLERVGVDVQTRDGLALLDDLPSTAHLLVLASSRRSLSERRSDALQRWVEDGGRLVLLATELWDVEAQSSGDRLLDRLGIRLLGSSGQPAWIQGLQELAGAESECGEAGDLTRIDPADGAQALQVQLARHRTLAYTGDRPVETASNRLGPQFYRLPLGTGELIVLTDLSLWRNARIGCWDNAHLLRLLARDRDRLWWLFNVEVPALPVAIWQRFPELVLAGLLWLLVWVWHSGFRPLPARRAAPAPRRQLVEQLDGVARFRWQQGERAELLAPLRRRLAPPAGRRQRTRLADEAGLAELKPLAEASGVSEAQLRWALTARPAGPQQLLRMVRLLQRLLNSP